MTTNRVTLTAADFGLDADGKRRRMKRIALTIQSAWASKANKHSARIRSAYKKMLSSRADERTAEVVFSGDGSGKDGALALMVEYGMGPGGIGTEGAYDVRKYLLTGGPGKMRPGPTKIVPFSHTHASMRAVAGGKETSNAVALQSFKASVSAGREKTIWGHRISAKDLPGPLRAADTQKKDVKGKNYTAFRHKTHVLAGMVKTQSTYSKGVKQTSGFKTFRTASWKGDPWMHPGIKAGHYGEQVRRELPGLIGGLI